jgi:hypothetical protein
MNEPEENLPLFVSNKGVPYQQIGTEIDGPLTILVMRAARPPFGVSKWVLRDSDSDSVELIRDKDDVDYQQRGPTDVALSDIARANAGVLRVVDGAPAQEGPTVIWTCDGCKHHRVVYCEMGGFDDHECAIGEPGWLGTGNRGVVTPDWCPIKSRWSKPKE